MSPAKEGEKGGHVEIGLGERSMRERTGRFLLSLEGCRTRSDERTKRSEGVGRDPQTDKKTDTKRKIRGGAGEGTVMKRHMVRKKEPKKIRSSKQREQP